MSSDEVVVGVLESFGNEDNPPRQFLNELLYVALSQITLRRRMFPISVYATKSFYSSLVEVVVPQCGLENVLKFYSALRSIMQAMDAEYLRSVHFSLHECGSPAESLETYSITFCYNNPSAVRKLQQPNTDLDLIFELKVDNRKDQVTQLLRQIMSLSFGNSRNSAKEYFVAFHIFFYENTPWNYSLPCFEPCPPSLRGVKQAPKAKRLRLEEGESSGRAEEAPKETLSLSNESILAGESEPLFNFDSQQQVNQTAGAASVARTNNASQESSKENEYNCVRCPCGDSEDDGLMIACVYCRAWQHAICFRVISQDVAPEKHVCVECAKKYNDQCTDTELTNEVHTAESVEIMCAFRRALAFCAYEKRVSLTNLLKFLECSASKARKVFDQLKTLNVLKASKGFCGIA